MRKTAASLLFAAMAAVSSPAQSRDQVTETYKQFESEVREMDPYNDCSVIHRIAAHYALQTGLEHKTDRHVIEKVMDLVEDMSDKNGFARGYFAGAFLDLVPERQRVTINENRFNFFGACTHRGNIRLKKNLGNEVFYYGKGSNITIEENFGYCAFWSRSELSPDEGRNLKIDFQCSQAGHHDEWNSRTDGYRLGVCLRCDNKSNGELPRKANHPHL